MAVDPQAACARELRRRFKGDDRVHVVEAALAAAPGEYVLHLNRTDVVASMSTEWMAAVDASGRFGQGSEWTGEQRVFATTLDALIEKYGVPGMCKIDVEGFEPEVLAGLSQPIPCVSFEFTAEVIEQALRCVSLLDDVGSSEFALSFGEELALASDWLSPDAVRDHLRSLTDERAWGDVYARCR